uniref:Large ribosomal subunit protein eL39 n=1 Tax=Monodelphis domestica TaxID=13616 RepID=A0A5F8GDK9_MONDO
MSTSLGFLAKKSKRNCLILQWVHMKNGHKTRHDSKGRLWRRTRLDLRTANTMMHIFILYQVQHP